MSDQPNCHKASRHEAYLVMSDQPNICISYKWFQENFNFNYNLISYVRDSTVKHLKTRKLYSIEFLRTKTTLDPSGDHQLERILA